jgi:uncharacterized protein YbjT (DUF2867 family)
MAISSNSKQLILVTGATGNQGGAIARALLLRGFPVRALTRDRQKPKAQALAQLGAEVVQGDLDKPESIQQALQDVYGVFAVQNFWETGAEREIQQGILLADMAKALKVQHFVYSSVGSANLKTGVLHFDTKGQIEEHIRSLDLPYTILRPVAFNYSWNDPSVRNYVLNGVFSLPLSPNTKLQLMSEEDYGVFVVLALENPEKWLGRSLDLVSEELTMLQMVEAFQKVIGRSVQYVKMSWEQSLQAFGEEYTLMFRWFEDVGYSANLNLVRQEYSNLTTLEQYLRQHGWDKARSTADAVAE